jgi:hypothetical protein
MWPDLEGLQHGYRRGRLESVLERHHFSTDSVDKSVSKVFSPAQNALLSAFVTDWLKNKQYCNT